MRSRLDLANASADWQALPWETIANEDFLAAALTRPFVRWWQPRDTSELAGGWPWRVLIVGGEELREADILSLQAEIEAVEEALWERRREVVVKRLDRPALLGEGGLRETLRSFQPHILHYVGHGAPNFLPIAAKGEDTRPEYQPPWEWDRESMADCFDQGAWPLPHLVFLNACHTMGGALDSAGLESLTSLFLGLGVPAVAGMHGAVNGAVARGFAVDFYSQLAKGLTLDAAFCEARFLAIHKSQDQPRHAFLGRLTVARPPEEILPWTGLATSRPACPEVSRLLGTFVDRNEKRHEFFDKLQMTYTPGAGRRLERPEQSNVLVLYGDESCGKTDLARLTLLAMADRGWHARWHRVADESPDWLGVLRRFRKGLDVGKKHRSGILSDPLPDETFARFDEVAERSEKDVTEVCRAMRDGLLNMAQPDRPVVLALDFLTEEKKPAHLAGAPPSLPPWLDVLAENVLAPLMRQESAGRPVLVLFVMTTAEALGYRAPLAEKLAQDIPTVKVAHFEPAEAKWAMRQYFARRIQEVKEEYFNQQPDSQKTIAALWKSMQEQVWTLYGETGRLGPKQLENFFNTGMKVLQEARLASPWQP